MNTKTNKVTVGTNTSTTASQWQTDGHHEAERGWECPRCGRINAPWVRSCDCSRDSWSITQGGSSIGSNEWWRQYVPCTSASLTQLDSETFKIHPESGPIWKAPNSTCVSDSATVAKSDPNIVHTYVTGTNNAVGGSDYQDEINKTWTNIPNVSNNVTSEDSPWNKYFTLTSDKINELQTQINNLKETK